MKDAVIRQEAWGAIRRSNTRLFIDIATLHPTLETCKAEAERVDQSIPQWAKDNPVVEYTKVRLFAYDYDEAR